MTLLFIGCNNPSEKHLELEAAQASLEKNLEMYTMVWDAVFKDKNLDMINEEYFDKDVVAVATSAGDVVGLENFKAYYGNYITGFSANLDNLASMYRDAAAESPVKIFPQFPCVSISKSF